MLKLSTFTFAGLAVAAMTAASPAAARCSFYAPPKPGTTFAYFTSGTQEVTGGEAEKVALTRHATVVSTEGNSVVLQLRDPRSDRDDTEAYQVTYFRGLWAYRSRFGGSAQTDLRFDPAPAARLWPLAPGKKATITGVETQPARGDQPALTLVRTQVTIEVLDEDTIATAAGRFQTCRLRMTIRTWRLEQPPHKGDLYERPPAYTRLATEEQRTVWLAPRVGLPVKEERVVTSYGVPKGSGVASVERTTTVAVWVKGPPTR